MTVITELRACDRMTRARLFAGLDQNQMAEMLGKSRNTVSAWERGVNEPPLSAVAAWAQITGRSIDWIVWGDEGQPKPGDYRSEGWEFESLRARDCVETVDAQFWSIVGRQVFPDALFAFPVGVDR